MKKQQQDVTSAPLHLLFIAVIAIIILLAFILAFFYNTFAHAQQFNPLELIFQARAGLQPKPLERFVFLILGVMVPIISFFMALKLFHAINKNVIHAELRVRVRPLPLCTKVTVNHLGTSLAPWLKSCLITFPSGISTLLQRGIRANFLSCKAMFTRNIIRILIFFTAALLYMPFIGYDFSRAFAVQAWLPSQHPFNVLVMTLLVAAGWYIRQFSRTNPSWSPRANRRNDIICGIIFVTVMMLQICAWRIPGEMAITQDGRWNIHADAVLYAMSQVMADKTLLIDLPSQYGLYPELLKPIFKLIGLSIFSFTTVCAVLQLLSLSSIYWVIHRTVRDVAIKVVFGLALLMVTFATIGWLLKYNDPYYQYWPIRFFWPALSIFLFYRYSNKSTYWRALQVSLAGVIGTIWNMDSGLMIVLAFADVLVAKWVVLWCNDRMASVVQRRTLRNVLIMHITTFAMITSLMFAYLSLKGGGDLHWGWLLGYQKIFYGLGFMMMPMPLHPYPWMSILGIYLIALIVSARSWVFNPVAKNADLLTFISLLGLGIFIYYEGRSHPLNLITICWPALMLTALLADRVLRAVHAGLLSRKHLMLPVAALSVLLFCSIPLTFSLAKLGKQVLTRFEHRNIPADEWVSDELRFIRENSQFGDKCLILSRRQGLYYAATGLGSPIQGPGFVETILQRYRDKFLHDLINERPTCIFVGVNHPLEIAAYWYPIVSKLVQQFNIKHHQHVEPQVWIDAGNGSTSALDLGVDLQKILHDYHAIARSYRGSMVYFRLNVG